MFCVEWLPKNSERYYIIVAVVIIHVPLRSRLANSYAIAERTSCLEECCKLANQHRGLNAVRRSMRDLSSARWQAATSYSVFLARPLIQTAAKF